MYSCKCSLCVVVDEQVHKNTHYAVLVMLRVSQRRHSPTGSLKRGFSHTSTKTFLLNNCYTLWFNWDMLGTAIIRVNRKNNLAVFWMRFATFSTQQKPDTHTHTHIWMTRVYQAVVQGSKMAYLIQKLLMVNDMVYFNSIILAIFTM